MANIFHINGRNHLKMFTWEQILLIYQTDCHQRHSLITKLAFNTKNITRITKNITRIKTSRSIIITTTILFRDNVSSEKG